MTRATNTTRAQPMTRYSARPDQAERILTVAIGVAVRRARQCARRALFAAARRPVPSKRCGRWCREAALEPQPAAVARPFALAQPAARVRYRPVGSRRWARRAQLKARADGSRIRRCGAWR